MRRLLCLHSLTAALSLLLFVPGVVVRARQMAQAPSAETSRGIELYKKGDTREAIALLTAAVKANRADGLAWYYLGLARVKEDDLKEARKAFETAVSLLPEFAPAHSSLAYTLMLLGKTSEAAREANAAIKLNTQDANARYVLGTAHLLNRQTSAALDEAEAAIKAQPSLAVAYLLKSQSLLTTYSDAVASSSKVVRAPSDAPPTERARQEIRARGEHQTELMRSAVEAFPTYLKLAPPGPETEGWQYQLKTMRVYAGVNQPKEATNSTASVSSGSGVLTRAVILNRCSNNSNTTSMSTEKPLWTTLRRSVKFRKSNVIFA